MAVMAQEILSATIKAKLLTVLPTINFINEDEVKRYRCAQCHGVAIYHYIATCKHIFCGKCHSSVSNKPCPVENCSNPSINEVLLWINSVLSSRRQRLVVDVEMSTWDVHSYKKIWLHADNELITQDREFELGVYNLNAHCMFEGRGCEEIITLKQIMDHNAKCKYSSNLLPKVWTPSLKDMEYVMKELSKLKRAIEEMQPDMLTRKEKFIKWEMDGLRSYFDLKSDKSMKLVQDKEKKMQADIDKLQSSFDLKLNNVRDDLLIEVTSKLTQRTERLVQEVEKKLMGQMTDQMSNIQTDFQQTLLKECEKMKKQMATAETENYKAMENFKEDFKYSFAKDIETKAKVEAQNTDKEMKVLKNKLMGEMAEQKSDLQKQLSTESHRMEIQRKELEEKFMQQMTEQKSDLQQNVSAECGKIKTEIVEQSENLKQKLEKQLTISQAENSKALKNLEVKSEAIETKVIVEAQKSENKRQELEKKLTGQMTEQNSNLQQKLNAESQKMENHGKELEEKFIRQIQEQKSECEKMKMELKTCVEVISRKFRMGQVIYAINAGGEAHTDVHGVRYQKDPLEDEGGYVYDFGKRYQVSGVPPADQLLYQTQRCDLSTFAYDVSIPYDAHYVLVLKFCEFYESASNERVFNVRLNDASTVISKLDIYDKVGQGVAHDEYVPFEISKRKLIVGNSNVKFNGVLRVEFVKGPEYYPIVSAFYVMKGTVDDVPKLPPLEV